MNESNDVKSSSDLFQPQLTFACLLADVKSREYKNKKKFDVSAPLQVMTFGRWRWRWDTEQEISSFVHSYMLACLLLFTPSHKTLPNKKRTLLFWDYSLSHLKLVIRGFSKWLINFVIAGVEQMKWKNRWNYSTKFYLSSKKSKKIQQLGSLRVHRKVINQRMTATCLWMEEGKYCRTPSSLVCMGTLNK